MRVGARRFTKRCGLQIQQIPYRILHRLQLVVVQSTEFSLKGVLVDAGESLDIDGGMLREPLGFSNINLPSQSPKLGCEGDNNYEGARIRWLGKCQNKNRSLLCGSAEINGPDLPGVGINTRQELPPMLCPVRRL